MNEKERKGDEREWKCDYLVEMKNMRNERKENDVVSNKIKI